jgi:hypothetical protein
VTTSFFGANGNGANGPATALTLGASWEAGLLFKVTASGYQLTGYGQWITGDGAMNTALTFALWQATGLNTGTYISGSNATISTLTPGTWQYVTLATPIALTSGQAYKVVTCSGSSKSLPWQNTMFGLGDTYAAGVVNGVLNLYSSASGSNADPFGDKQATFDQNQTDPTAHYPVSDNSDSNPWVDVLVAPAASPVANRQPPYLPPRRGPGRAVQGGARGPAFVAVTAPRQMAQYPRRKPGRAVVQFTPVTTVNAAPAVPGVANRQLPYLPPRRGPARVVWAGGRGPAFVAVAAPVQIPPTVYRRRPARVAWRGRAVAPLVTVPPRQPPPTVFRRAPARAYVRFTPVVTVNATGGAVAAPRQLITIPRRGPARAYVRFTPVTTVNAPPPPPVIHGTAVDDESREWKHWLLWEL